MSYQQQGYTPPPQGGGQAPPYPAPAASAPPPSAGYGTPPPPPPAQNPGYSGSAAAPPAPPAQNPGYGQGHSSPPPQSQGYGNPHAPPQGQPTQPYAPPPSNGYQPPPQNPQQPPPPQHQQQSGSYHQPPTQAPSSYNNPQSHQLRSWFDAVDADRSNSIDSEELRRALSTGGMQFSGEAAQLMIRMFDRSRKGTVNFDEFQSLHGYIIKMQEAFRQCDTDHSGTLTAHEVFGAITSSGYHLGKETFDTLMRKFDRNNRGFLAFDGYIELCVFLGTVRNTFAWYDTSRTGTVPFNFDNFTRAATYIAT